MFGDGDGEAVRGNYVGVFSTAFEFGEVAELEGDEAGGVGVCGGEGDDGGFGVVGEGCEVREGEGVFVGEAFGGVAGWVWGWG